MRQPLRWLVGVLTLLAGGAVSRAQQPAVEPEMTSHDAPATFQTKVNLVLVPVVVRDSKGKAIGNLKKEDFQLFDRGKPQTITKFSIEKPGSVTAANVTVSDENAAEGASAKTAPIVMPEHYAAYLFDDVHLNFEDLARTRDAARKQVAESVGPGDRVAIYSTSGQTTLDFTDDKAKIEETLFKLRPRPVARNPMTECPDVSYYMADLIQNKNDQNALQVAAWDAIICEHLDPSTMMQMAQAAAQSAASRMLSSGDTESRMAIGVLRDVVRRVAMMPGQRTVIVVSPGFLLPFLREEETEVIDRALRSNVVISALDARGLYTTSPTAADNGRPLPPAMQALKQMYVSESATAEADVLAEVAYGTGGSFYHNSNDLNGGFHLLAAAPEFIYLLGFSPQNLKLDGSYHKLKVSFTDKLKFELQARRGYFAPKHLDDPKEMAKQEISEALYSREVLQDIPVELHTQFFKTAEFDAKLAVLARVDVKKLRFKKVDGRNCNDLTVVAGLFDRNGNFIVGQSKTIEMRLRDETLEKRLGAGITIKTSFDVKPGGYFVRLVVRDGEGESMAAQNGAVEIP